MHKNEDRPNVICLGTSKLNNSLNELKEFFKFNIIFSSDHSKDILKKIMIPYLSIMMF